MKLDRLVASLPARKGAIITLAAGKPVRHDFKDLAADVAKAKQKLTGWGVKAGTRVGIFAPNSYLYIVHDLALVDMRAITVPFTDDFAGEIGPALAEKYRLALMLLSKSAKHGFGESDGYVGLLDGETDAVAALDRAPYGDGDDPDDLCLAFSSGSAGGLKGLVISRLGAELTLPPVVEAIDVHHDDRLLLFLPMSNFQQRMMYYAAIWYDFDIAVTDFTQLYPALKILEPSILIAPPVFYQLLQTRFAALMQQKQMLVRLLALLPGHALRLSVARRVFQEVYAVFGGRIRLLISGMAPLNRSAIRFFEKLQLPLSESYGMAEAGSLTYRPPFSRKYASVGKPLRGVTIAFEPDGEIIISREQSLTRKYFQCAPGENESTFLGKGRVASGDIGAFDEGGYLQLLGRKKELIITPGGYKIHPEILEGELNACDDIVQSVVLQKPGLSYLTCVVVPGQDRSDDALSRIRRHVDTITVGKKIRIGDVVIVQEGFSAQNGLLRPNLKLNRKAIAARYCA